MAELRHPCRGTSLADHVLHTPSATASERARVRLLIYCATIGEYRAISPVISELESRYGEVACTFVLLDPAYAQALAKDRPEARIFRAPGPSLARNHALLKEARPQLVLFAEGPALPGRFPRPLDLGIIAACAARRIPLVVANACLYRPQFGSRIDRIEARLFTAMFLGAVTRWYASHPRFAEALISAGAPRERVRITGDLKFDTAALLAQTTPPPETGRFIERLTSDGTSVLVAGCVTAVDEVESVIQGWQEARMAGLNLRVVVAPRYVNNEAAMRGVFGALEGAGVRFVRRSQFRDGEPVPDVTVVDTIGELAFLYQHATVAYAGRNHGVLEPLAAAVPTLVSSETNWKADNSSYPLYAMLAEDEVIYRLGPEESLATPIIEFLRDPALRARQRARISEAFARHRGSAQRTVDDLEAGGIAGLRGS